MPRRGVVSGQKVAGEKLERAREMRRAPTEAEEALWHALRRNQLGAHFRRQQLISGFIVDFYCHSAGLVIEIDGAVHDSPDQRDADRKRDQALSELGLHIQRFRNEEILSNLPAALNKIRTLLRAR